jgi:hypothetical protein
MKSGHLASLLAGALAGGSENEILESRSAHFPVQILQPPASKGCQLGQVLHKTWTLPLHVFQAFRQLWAKN